MSNNSNNEEGLYLFELDGRGVAFAQAERRKPEPVGENTAALVVRVECKQPVKSILLFTSEEKIFEKEILQTLTGLSFIFTIH